MDRKRILLAAFAGLLLASLAPPAYAAGASLSLSPSRGDSSSEFTATFRTTTTRTACRGGTVTFTWDTFLVLTARPLGSDCIAVANGLAPPQGANRIGIHAVVARLVDPAGAQATAQAVFAILRVGATPAPTPTAAASPAPQPTAPASPGACDTRVARALGSSSFLEIAGIAGAVTDIEHMGAMAVARVAPAAMLPPAIGTAPLGEVSLTRVSDRGSAGLQQAAGERRLLPCAHLELGASSQFVYAIYAFSGALVTSVSAAGGSPPQEKVTVRYQSVRWEYQPRDSRGNPAPVVTGSGTFGQTPVASHRAADASGPNVLLFVLAGLLVLGILGAGALFLLRTGRWPL